MSDYKAIAEIIDETVCALSNLDLDKLVLLEQKINELAQTRIEADREGANAVMHHKARLEIVLQNCKPNLDTLHHLYDRKMRNEWAR